MLAVRLLKAMLIRMGRKKRKRRRVCLLLSIEKDQSHSSKIRIKNK